MTTLYVVAGIAAYLAVAVVFARWCVRLWSEQFDTVTDGDLWFFAGMSLVWPLSWVAPALSAADLRTRKASGGPISDALRTLLRADA